MSRRIGIMGGTFDPIHYGHLSIASSAHHQLQLDKVLFIPAARPPHKQGQSAADGAQRAEMIALAIANEPRFELSKMELQRQGYSYSIDTVLELRQQYGPETELFFITGADMILTVQTWMRAEELRQYCRFAAAPRPGFDLAALQQLPAAWQERITVLDAPLLQISGSLLRARAACGQPIKYLLPDAVIEYIERSGLYK